MPISPLLQDVSSPVLQAPNPLLGDLRGEWQRARRQLIGDGLGRGQHDLKSSRGGTRWDTDSISEGEQGSTGETVLLAEHRQREGVIAVRQRGGKVVGRGDAPFACGCGKDGNVLGVDIPVSGEPCEAELPEDVTGCEGPSGALGAQGGRSRRERRAH